MRLLAFLDRPLAGRRRAAGVLILPLRAARRLLRPAYRLLRRRDRARQQLEAEQARAVAGLAAGLDRVHAAVLANSTAIARFEEQFRSDVMDQLATARRQAALETDLRDVIAAREDEAGEPPCILPLTRGWAAAVRVAQ